MPGRALAQAGVYLEVSALTTPCHLLTLTQQENGKVNAFDRKPEAR